MNREEIKMFLIYLDLSMMTENDLNTDGWVALYQLGKDYPQFHNRKKEIKAIMDYLDKEKV